MFMVMRLVLFQGNQNGGGWQGLDGVVDTLTFDVSTSTDSSTRSTLMLLSAIIN